LICNRRRTGFGAQAAGEFFRISTEVVPTSTGRPMTWLRRMSVAMARSLASTVR
jgi:hypothetical protein